MPDPTATNQYVINNLPVSPGDISVFVFPIDGGNTFQCWNVGKLYYGICIQAGSSAIAGINSGLTHASADRLAFLIGATVSSYYENANQLSLGSAIAWNGAAWVGSGNVPDIYLAGFLIN